MSTLQQLEAQIDYLEEKYKREKQDADRMWKIAMYLCIGSVAFNAVSFAWYWFDFNLLSLLFQYAAHILTAAIWINLGFWLVRQHREKRINRVTEALLGFR